MSSPTVLATTIRTGRGKGPARQARMVGGVPAEVYGLGQPNQSILVDAHQLQLILNKGMNTIINLQVDGAEQITVCRQIQRHPVKGSLQHVDFIRVDAKVEIEADVPLSLVGESAGVALGGLLEQLVFSVAITAKPGAIPTSIEHDVTALDLGDQVRAGDLTLPAGVTLQLEPDELLAMISIPRALAAQGGEEGEEAEGAEAE